MSQNITESNSFDKVPFRLWAIEKRDSFSLTFSKLHRIDCTGSKEKSGGGDLQLQGLYFRSNTKFPLFYFLHSLHIVKILSQISSFELVFHIFSYCYLKPLEIISFDFHHEVNYTHSYFETSITWLSPFHYSQLGLIIVAFVCKSAFMFSSF